MSKSDKLSEQRGTLLVEAIAMLGLIALVTPTLYKKSADRLQEIQDINVASQARTMNAIIETFIKSNFAQLMEAVSSASGETVELSYDDDKSGFFAIGYSSYVPFGYTPGELKNYGKPHVYVHKDNNSLISYVVYPTLIDPGKKRASRLASLVGANGGMVSKPFGAEGSSYVYGTGGAWELDPGMVDELGIQDATLVENSLVVTSPEPIVMSDADSDKFLYRVPPDGGGKDYHNTMVTDLFMGGHNESTEWRSNSREFHSIFNVRKLTLNTDCNRSHLTDSAASSGVGDGNLCQPNVADLYIGKPFYAGNTDHLGTANEHLTDHNVSGNTGAAWIYGNLSAVMENFRLFYTGDDALGERTNGYDVLQFARKSGNWGEDTVDVSVLRAENPTGSARVSMLDDFVQVRENGTAREFLVGASSAADGLEGGFIHAYKLGTDNILRLNSPEDLADGMGSNNFVTHINRKGGTVYINGGSSVSDTMNTYINDIGGVLSAGSSGSWLYAANWGASSRVDLLNGADLLSESDNRIFTLGSPDESGIGNMMYANSSRSSLRGGKLRVFNITDTANVMASSSVGGIEMMGYMPDNGGPNQTIDGATAILTRYTDIWGSVYLGANSMQPANSVDGIYSRGNWKLGVAGSAWVDDTLWARRAWLKDAGMGELHAGFSSYADWINHPKGGWLNAYSSGVSVRNRAKVQSDTPGDNSSDTMFYADSSKVVLRDLEGAWAELTQGSARFGAEESYIYADSSAVEEGGMHVVGQSLVNIYTNTEDRENYVNIQKDAMKFGGQPGDDSSVSNTIQAKAGEFAIQTDGEDRTLDDAQFYANNENIRTRYVDFTVENSESSAVFKVMPQGDNSDEDKANVQVHGTINVEGNSVIHIASNEENRATTESGKNSHAMLEVEPSYVQVWAREHNGTDSSWGSYAGATEGGGYYAMLKINPGDIAGDSSNVDDTGNASVYIRRGAIELETSKSSGNSDTGSDFAADQGYGYIMANRFVSNADGVSVPAPYTVGGTTGAENSGAYDQYMVNPAYTSVMHDIKLTTRGGARLSDILPDYVLKGVYNLINDRKESNSETKASGMGSWAHPYIGIVPYASCPPGYVNMATVIPISFNMGQAGDLIKASAMSRDGLHGTRDRWVVNPYSRQVPIVQDGKDIAYPGLHEFSSWVFNTTGNGGSSFIDEFAPVKKSRIEGWYWGFNAVHPDNTGSTTDSKVNTDTGGGTQDGLYIPWTYQEDLGSEEKVVAEALYFQQNTWLKTSIDPRSDHHGWNAYMGFLYDVKDWTGGPDSGAIHQNEAPVRSNYNEGRGNQNTTDVDNLPGEYVWNLFPIPTNTLEGHATVYCYFDRQAFSSWGDGMVDQIDQLGSLTSSSNVGFRELYEKPDSNYTKRLNDPTLKYTDPW